MRLGLFALILALGTPLPWVEVGPSVEEDAILEVARPARRPSRLERQKVAVLHSAAAPVPPRPRRERPVSRRPGLPTDIALVCPRPPPSAA
ncbi:MAG: hypothetical protein JO332_00350 [Planctomycetaceae bacterium]|nr:hypothetical protein [Planctomycetaceae bacterium]